jgi:hypothetical protein
MCIVAGIVRSAEFAHHIVPHRGEVNSSPTLARRNLDQASSDSALKWALMWYHLREEVPWSKSTKDDT